jgi:hypothetical protein
MGADIYLRSVATEEVMIAVKDRVLGAAHYKWPGELVDEFYKQMRAAGGYFRNGYNSGDAMWAIGLSWPGTVGPLLTVDARLPIERARELVAMIEARPLTRESFARHFLANMTSGVEQHPLTGRIHTLMYNAADEAAGLPPQPLLPPEFENAFAFVSERREELLALLRRSIELGEPLECSL